MWQLSRPADVVEVQVGEHDRPDRRRLNAARTRLRNDVLTTSDAQHKQSVEHRAELLTEDSG